MNSPGLFIPTYGQEISASKTQDHARTNSNVKSRSSARKLPSNRPREGLGDAAQGKRSLLPTLVFNGNIEYIQTLHAGEHAGQAIEAARPLVMGFDIEWQVSFVPGEVPRRTATLQLCVPKRDTMAIRTRHTPLMTSEHPGNKESLVWGTAFIFQLCHMRLRSPDGSSRDEVSTADGAASSGDRESQGADRKIVALPDSVVRVLSDPDILLVGVGIGGDVCRLEKEYEQLRACGVKGVRDLSEMAKRKIPPSRRRRGMWSLADLCAEVLELELRKPHDLRRGNWEKRPLSVDQLSYAATDAYAGLRLWQVMEKMPDTLLRQVDNAGGVQVISTDTKGEFECSNGTEMSRTTSAGDTEEGRATWVVQNTRTLEMLPLSKLETHRLWHKDRLSVEAVAEIRCNKVNTVLGYLADCIEAGMPYEWARIVISPDTEASIVRSLLAASNTEAAAVAREGAVMTEAGGAHDTGRKWTANTPGTIAQERRGSVDDRAYNPATQTVSQVIIPSLQGVSVNYRSDDTGDVEDKTNASSTRSRERWDSIRLKDVKALIPHAEYWQIRLILARFKSGWSAKDFR